MYTNRRTRRASAIAAAAALTSKKPSGGAGGGSGRKKSSVESQSTNNLSLINRNNKNPVQDMIMKSEDEEESGSIIIKDKLPSPASADIISSTTTDLPIKGLNADISASSSAATMIVSSSTIDSEENEILSTIQKQQQQQKQQQELSNNNNNNASIKAVGARRRKPTQISKIETQVQHQHNSNGRRRGGVALGSDNEEDDDDDDDDDDEQEEEEEESELEEESIQDSNKAVKRNGMIQSIVTELKSAKVKGNYTQQKADPNSSSDQGKEQQQNNNNNNEDDVEEEEEQDEGEAGSKATATVAEDDYVVDDVAFEEGNDHANNHKEDDEVNLGGGARLLRKRRSVEPSAAYLQGIVMMNKGRKASTSSTASAKKSKTELKRLRKKNKLSLASSKKGAKQIITKQQQEDVDDDDEDREKQVGRTDELDNNNEAGQGAEEDDEAGEDAGDEEDSYSEDGVDMKNVTLRKRTGSNNEEHCCALCSYTCGDKSTLVRHMRKHSGERPYQCKLCSFGFTTKANCERHLRNRHGQIDRSQLRGLIECHLQPNSTVTASNDGSESSENETIIKKQLSSPLPTKKQNPVPENKPTTSSAHLYNNGLFNPAFIPTTSHAALLSNELQKSAPFMMHHPMFFGAAAAAAANTNISDFGLTIANAHSNSNISTANAKRNLFLESLNLSHFFTAGGAPSAAGFPFPKANLVQQQQQPPVGLPLLTTKQQQIPQPTNETSAAPLDLSMDAVDLSVKRRSSRTDSNDMKTLPKPKAMYPLDSLSQSLVTSPFVTKRELTSHPQLPLANFSVQNALQSADLSLSGLGSVPTTQSLGSTPFPLFPFPNPNSVAGGPASFPYGLPTPSTLDKYMGLSSVMGSAAPSKNHASNSFLSSSPPLATATSSNFGSSDGYSDKSHNDKLASTNRIQQRPTSAKSSSLSPNPVSSSRHHKRSDKRRGDFQKPKQRRYRTERPFACPHCPAKFTLRSNMERHGKHQHPNVWQRSPSNRVINRQKNLANQQQNPSPLLSSPTMVPTNKYSAMNGYDYNMKSASLNRKCEAEALTVANSVNVRAVIAQQLKRKMSNTNLRNIKMEVSDESGEEGEVEMGAAATFTNTNGLIGNADLASVSQLLDRAKTSNFVHFFKNEPAENSSSSGNNHGNGNNEIDRHNNNSNDQSETESNHGSTTSEGDIEEEPEDEDYDDEDENDNKRIKLNNNNAKNSSVNARDRGDDGGNGIGGGEKKKKSAYSSAPHKISCPHCTRRFPWTSSLRRHLLTHTGQKPYQCSQCPLLFTTKSNCDRHLVRKHNGTRGGNGNDNAGGGGGSSRARRGRKRKESRSTTAAEELDNGSSILVTALTTASSTVTGNSSSALTASSVCSSSNNDNADERNEEEDDDFESGAEADAEVEAGSCSQNEEAAGKNSAAMQSQGQTVIPEKKQRSQQKAAKGTESLLATSTPVNNSKGGTPSSNNSSPGEDVAFRCHLCDASAVERDILLSHMEEDHKETFQLLVAKGALVNSPTPQSLSTSPQSENNSEDSIITSAMATAAVTTPLSVGSESHKDLTHRKVMCVFCVRRFWSVEDLRRHIRSHSGERPFTCPHCSRRFTLKHSMLRHIKKHETSKKNYEGVVGGSTTPVCRSSKVVVSNSLVNLITTNSQSVNTSNNNNTISTIANRKTDLIGRLLGISDERLVEELLSKSDARDAAELLGLNGNGSINSGAVEEESDIATAASSPSTSATTSPVLNTVVSSTS